MNTFFGQTFVCLIVMLKNKTRAIEDINISIALVDSWVRPLIGQCKLNDIVTEVVAFFVAYVVILRYVLYQFITSMYYNDFMF